RRRGGPGVGARGVREGLRADAGRRRARGGAGEPGGGAGRRAGGRGLGDRPETLSRVGNGQPECCPVGSAPDVPRPAEPARQTFRSVSSSLKTTGPAPRPPPPPVLRFAAPACSAAARRA